ncbi:MAG: TIGR03960 family B12-binding radical SAM protein, partial [Chloroflexota bacterium]
PLFSLESRKDLREFDVIGLFLPYEQLYTNALNLLDLAGLPVLAINRDETMPLVIAGGHSTFNPEPMSGFIDAFVIGEAEDLVIELLDLVDQSKDQHLSRDLLLKKLSRVEGIYVPSLYEASYASSGEFIGIKPVDSTIPDVIRKRIVSPLPPPPTKPIVPFARITHDRAMVEIMRGCTRGCRYCQAGFISRPVRERNRSVISRAVEEILQNTGYTEVGLLSLSSSDYSDIHKLIGELTEIDNSTNLSISLPSLRIETASGDLMEAARGGRSRKSSATFAPEVANDKMRHKVNKDISSQQLLNVVDDIFSRGWRTIKLYFMIGFPDETMDDVHDIALLAKEVYIKGRRHHGRRTKVNVSISTLVPKPHTPFQWVPLASRDDIIAKQALLMQETRARGINLKWNSYDETEVESVLSRGDRRIGESIHRAWKQGARFDAWHEHFDYERWMQAFAETNIVISSFTTRDRSTSEILPWNHIDTGVSASFLQKQLESANFGELTVDCRESCFNCGILQAFGHTRQNNDHSNWGCP